MTNSERKEVNLGYMDMHQKWFEEAIEQGKSFDRIHQERLARDSMVELYEEEDGYTPIYNPRTRRWE